MATYALEFTEEMKGFFTLGESDYAKGERQGTADGTAIMFHLTIRTEDTFRFIQDRDHVAVAKGWVGSDVFGGRLPVERGVFNLFVDEGPAHKHMLYRLWFADGVGHPLTLSGFKEIVHNDPTHVWPETSTLYTKIYAGHVEAADEPTAEVLGAGIIHILKQDFARQLTTFRVYGPDLAGRAKAFVAFGQLFMGQLWDVFAPWKRTPKGTEHVDA
jgi:cholesterol oxidase